MKTMFRRIRVMLVVVQLMLILPGAGWIHGQRHMEYLDRGLVAVARPDRVFLSWRIFATDTAKVEFNLYRNDTLVNPVPIDGVSNYTDTGGTNTDIYHLETVTDDTLIRVSKPVTVWKQNYLTVPLQTPAGYAPNDASVADLDGDGELEIVVKMEGRTQDNANKGITDPVHLQAYKMNGTFLWSINLGINIRGGAHYTQFMVYDLDGDGRAEVACKTAPGTRDGSGAFLSDGPAAGDNDGADYRNSDGYILDGPEYLTVFDGLTGRECSTVGYIPRRSVPYALSTWGDTYGNRVDRFLACVAYFDTIPSLVMCRGYYDRTTLTAWDFKDQQLVQLWAFDTETDQANLKQYEGQGSHGISVGDVDHDGKDEIMYGAEAFDDDGTPLYNTRFGHGDASHMSDLIPDHPGLEFYMPHEGAGKTHDGITNPGISVRDAATGEILWSIPATGDIGRALTADIAGNYPGNEFWAAGGLGVYSSSGATISSNRPSINFASWWDGDLLRELLDGNVITKWGGGTLLTGSGCSSNNGTKSTPALSGDILGDWREEVIWRTSDNQSLRIYTTTIPTEYGIYTLLQDPQYRLALAWQNVAYNQPPHPGFFLGQGMEPPPVPNIKITDPASSPVLQILSPRNGEVLNLGLDMDVFIYGAGIPDTNQLVVLYLNDTTLLDSLFAPPYSATLPGLASGEHTLTASAYDLEGNLMVSSPVTFSVDEGYPHVRITAPARDAEIGPGESITVEVEAYDTDGTVDSVAIFMNGLQVATLTREPYSTTIAEPDKGVIEIGAVAWDHTGKSTESESVRVEVGAILTVQENQKAYCGFYHGSGSIDINHEGFTGTGFANSDNVQGVQMIWALSLSEPGPYSFTFRYACVEARPGTLYINDTLIGTVNFRNTGDWAAWESVSLDAENLTAGLKKVTLEADGANGLPNIDYMKTISLESDLPAVREYCSSLPLGTDPWKDPAGSERISLYPVPARQQLNIRCGDPAEHIRMLTLYRIDGSRVRILDHLDDNGFSLDVSGLESGIYLLRVDTDLGSYSRKFNVMR
jgi:rhamnogalacturonan endolyase